MCHHDSCMMEEITIPIHKQMHGSIKYISNIYEGVMQNEIYCN